MGCLDDDHTGLLSGDRQGITHHFGGDCIEHKRQGFTPRSVVQTIGVDTGYPDAVRENRRP